MNHICPVRLAGYELSSWRLSLDTQKGAINDFKREAAACQESTGCERVGHISGVAGPRCLVRKIHFGLIGRIEGDQVAVNDTAKTVQCLGLLGWIDLGERKQVF